MRHIKIEGVTLCGASYHCRTVNKIFYRSYFNFGAKYNWGWSPFADDECAFYMRYLKLEAIPPRFGAHCQTVNAYKINVIF